MPKAPADTVAAPPRRRPLQERAPSPAVTAPTAERFNQPQLTLAQWNIIGAALDLSVRQRGMEGAYECAPLFEAIKSALASPVTGEAG